MCRMLFGPTAPQANQDVKHSLSDHSPLTRQGRLAPAFEAPDFPNCFNFALRLGSPQSHARIYTNSQIPMSNLSQYETSSCGEVEQNMHVFYICIYIYPYYIDLFIYIYMYIYIYIYVLVVTRAQHPSLGAGQGGLGDGGFPSSGKASVLPPHGASLFWECVGGKHRVSADTNLPTLSHFGH